MLPAGRITSPSLPGWSRYSRELPPVLPTDFCWLILSASTFGEVC